MYINDTLFCIPEVPCERTAPHDGWYFWEKGWNCQTPFRRKSRFARLLHLLCRRRKVFRPAVEEIRLCGLTR